MSGERQITLTVCSGCGRGYRLRDMHIVDGPDGEQAYLCEECEQEYGRASQEPR